MASHDQTPEGSCPVTGGRTAESAAASPVPGVPAPLYLASQAEALSAEQPELGIALAWMRNFLARSHSGLGRSGAVCPFVGLSLRLDTIWLAAVPGRDPDSRALIDLIGVYRDIFTTLEPRHGDMAINKAIVVIFPELPSERAPELIESVQKELKSRFVEMGLMIGEFYEGNETPGLRHPDFRPLQSPLPMIAIRHMVESDLPFLTRDLDPPDRRSGFLRAYLRRLGGTINPRMFDAAVEALVRAEIEARGTARASSVEAAAP